MKNKQQQGFTLIELLIVIGIIAILAAIIFVAVDPARRLAEARNAERWSSVNAILNATLKYSVDNAGQQPPNLDTANDNEYYMIGTAGNGCDVCTAQNTQSSCLDLSGSLVDAYLAEVPQDPVAFAANNSRTGYFIMKSSSGRVTVGACEPESVGGVTTDISVSR